MRIVASKKVLSDAFGLLERIVPTRSSNPLLTSVHVEVVDTGLILSGTSADNSLQVSVPAEVMRHGQAGHVQFTLPCHLAGQIIRNFGGATVELSVEGNSCHLNSGGSSTSLATGDAAAFPALEAAGEDGNSLRLPAAVFLRALNHVRYAASTEAFQAVFRGIRIEWHHRHLRFVGSDGFRLAYTTLPPLDGAAAQHLIVPARFTPEVTAAFKGWEGDLDLTVSGGRLWLARPGLTLHLGLLDGDFPDYTRVIPASPTGTITLSAAALQESVARVSVMSDSNANYRLSLRTGHGQLTLLAENDYGRAADTLEAQLTGPCEEGFEIAYNARFLREALAGRAGDVTLALTNSASPTLITDTAAPENSAVLVSLKGG